MSDEVGKIATSGFAPEVLKKLRRQFPTFKKERYLNKDGEPIYPIEEIIRIEERVATIAHGGVLREDHWDGHSTLGKMSFNL